MTTAIPLPEPQLSDGELLLRPWREHDVPAISAACQDPEISRWTTVPYPYSERDGREHVARSEADRRAGRELSLGIFSERDGELLGSMSLAAVDRDNRTAEIGYWVARPARRRGVGTRAARLLARWAIAELGLERLQLLAHPENEASLALAEGAGFRREGVLRAYRRRQGVNEDLVAFSLLPGDLGLPVGGEDAVRRRS